MRWHAHYHTEGTGHLYQGRFKAFPIEADEYLLAVLRYVERNALRANLVDRAEDWEYGSLWRMVHGDKDGRDCFLRGLSTGPEHGERWSTERITETKRKPFGSASRRGALCANLPQVPFRAPPADGLFEPIPVAG